MLYFFFNDTYRAIITKKKETSVLSLISNFLLPRVYAEDEKIIEFTVEQTDKEIVNDNKEEVKNEIVNNEKNEHIKEPVKNPATNDNVFMYVLLGFLSIISIELLKRKVKKEL